MSVGELIEQLQRLPANLRAVIFDDEALANVRFVRMGRQEEETVVFIAVEATGEEYTDGLSD
jgi:hypothetical protein